MSKGNKWNTIVRFLGILGINYIIFRNAKKIHPEKEKLKKKKIVKENEKSFENIPFFQN